MGSEPLTEGRTYALVDGNNLMARCSFAAQASGVNLSADGVETTVMALFIRYLAKRVRLVEPTHLMVAMDSPGTLVRKTWFNGYKAARRPREEKLVPEDQCRELLTRLGVMVAAKANWEADDLIAWNWQWIRAQDPEAAVVIVSGDKDLLQLADEATVILRPATGSDDAVYGKDEVHAKYGVPARHLAKAMAMIGDAGDGVPGVPGVGPKKAAALLKAYDYDLDAVVNDQLARGRWSTEKAYLARLSYRLVNLRDQDYAALGWAAGEHCVMTDGALPLDTPMTPELVSYLNRYRLSWVMDRIESGQGLWG